MIFRLFFSKKDSPNYTHIYTHIYSESQFHDLIGVTVFTQKDNGIFCNLAHLFQ